MFRTVLAPLLILAISGPALAESRAVVVTTGDYAKLPDVPETGAEAVIERLKSGGFRVVEGRDLGVVDLRVALSDLLRPDNAPGARVVLLNGRFVHSRGESWFLGADAGTGNVLSAGGIGVPLSVVTDIMAGEGGPDTKGILILGTDEVEFKTGAGLKPGWGPVAAPDGISVIGGHAKSATLAAEILARPGGTVEEALKQGRSLRRVAGVGTGAVVPKATVGTVPVVVPSDPAPVVQPGTEEQAAWTRAKRTNSAAAYREFLEKYPNSIYAGAARGRISELTPVVVPTGPAAVEAELGLSRAQRQQIQRQLTLLTYDTRGIDGVFGSGTRAAISRFQRDSGLAATGYLTRAQIDLLDRNARLRQERLETEAKARQEAAEAADRAAWNRHKDAGAAGAERYLTQYPQGLFADQARKMLAKDSDGADDDAEWKRARSADTISGYRDYLEKYPRGRSVKEARQRLAAAEKQAEADKAAETALDLPPPVRLVVEQRLAAMGLKVGKVDGRFDADARTAIRRYQEARNLRATGYLNQSTLTRLLADTLLSGD